jgi:hypothetical protein
MRLGRRVLTGVISFQTVYYTFSVSCFFFHRFLIEPSFDSRDFSICCSKFFVNRVTPLRNFFDFDHVSFTPNFASAASTVPNASTSRRCGSLQNSSHHAEYLSDDIQQYIQLSIATSTQQTYSAGEKRFIDFVQLYQPKGAKHLFPTNEDTLVQFSAYLARSIKHSSIKNYLAAVRHLNIRNGFQL